MKRVSLSQIKSNIMGRRRESENKPNHNLPDQNGGCGNARNITSQEDDNLEMCQTQSTSGEVMITPKKELCRGNNIFSALRYKFKKKRATKSDDLTDCTRNPSAAPEASMSKKLRSKLPKYNSSAKRTVCPMPAALMTVNCNNPRVDISEDSSAEDGKPIVGLGLLYAAENNNDLSVCSPVRNREGATNREQLSSHEVTNHIVNLNINLPDSHSFEASSGSAVSYETNSLILSQKPGSLTRELFKLSRCGWYWGPITRGEAEEKLNDQPDGAFLVRDSSDDRYILSLSFRSCSNTLHTRIEHSNGLFSFYAVQHQPHFILHAGNHHPDAAAENNASAAASHHQQQDSEGRISIVALIEESMSYSQSGIFCYSRGRTPDSPSYPVRLTKPVSRFNQVRTLQYLCRFVIRQITRFDHIQKLPLPNPIKGYLEESHY